MPPRCVGINLTLKPFCSNNLESAPPSSPYPITTSNPLASAASAMGKRCVKKKFKSLIKIKSLIIYLFEIIIIISLFLHRENLKIYNIFKKTYQSILYIHILFKDLM